MIEVPVEQGTTAWQNARLGIPTASCFDRILTPAKLKPSESSRKYLYQKLAERLLGVPMEFGGSGATQRGSDMEPQAVAGYEFQNDCETRKSGLCLTDDRRIGCSVDRFVGDDGILEIKSPLAPQHIATLLGDGEDHRLQFQGQLWITGRKWVDLVSYFPELPPAPMRFERDEEVIAAIAEHVYAFADRLDGAEARLREMRGEAVAA